MNPIENLEELAREALNDAESLGHPLCSPMKVREASESRAKLFEAISALSGYQPTEGETGRAEVACQACGAAATRRVDEGTAFQGLYCDNCGPGALAFQTVPSAMPVPVDAVRRDQANILRSYATERMRLELPQMWHDLRVVADALTAPPPPMGGEPVGEALLDKDGVIQSFRPRVRYFFGARMDDDGYKLDAEDIAKIDQQYAGCAPHRTVLLYTSPMGGAAEGWVPASILKTLRTGWASANFNGVALTSAEVNAAADWLLAAAPKEGSQP